MSTETSTSNNNEGKREPDTPLSPLVQVTIPKADLLKNPKRIPLTSETDKKIDRLESLILAQHDETKKLRDLVHSLMGNAPREEHSFDKDEEGEEEIDDIESENEEEIAQVENKEEQSAQPKPPPDAGFAKSFVPVTTGPAIADEVARGLSYVLRNPLDADAWQEISKANKPPSNVPALTTPKCNETIFKNVHGNARNTDYALQDIHDQLVTGIVAVAKLAPTTITPEWGQALTALAHTSYELNMTRRRLLKPSLQQQYVQLCSPSVELTSQLFGDDLSKEVRDITDVNKATEKMMKKRNRPPTQNNTPKKRKFEAQGYNFKQQEPFLAGKAPPRQKPLLSFPQTAARGASSRSRGNRGKGQQQYHRQ